MFNKNDFFKHTLEACCVTTKMISQTPKDYFLGLPDPPLIIPKNILFFSRQTAFDEEQGISHHHHRFLLIICLEEEGSVIVDDSVVRLKPGCALLITPYQFHHYAPFKKSELLWLFASFELDNSEEFYFLRGQAQKLIPIHLAYLHQMLTCYTALNNQQIADPEITILLALMLEEFRRNPTKKKSLMDDSAPSTPLIHDVTRYVNSHVTEAIQIADVAKAIGFSESYLRSKFHELAGIGLGTYIRRLRFHRARTLMLTSDLLLKEIAELCGYDSIYTFSRAFKQEMKISPSTYRKNTLLKRKKS